MRYFTLCSLLSILLGALPVSSDTPAHIAALYRRLDPLSIPELIAFHELYPETPEGESAQASAWALLTGESSRRSATLGPLFSPTLILSLLAPFTSLQFDGACDIGDEELELAERLGRRLPNHSLKGHWIISKEELLALPPDEVSLSRGLLITLFGGQPGGERLIRIYEALLDVMALQILPRAPLNSSPEKKIDAINHLLFSRLRLRFPPHSLYSKEVDLYTFLPSVLESKRGVCLGVSTLYLALAQRLALPLEAVTPPGHIYLRYRDAGQTINIETTHRGVDLPTTRYLSIHTRDLQVRNIKEVIGATFFNQAASLWQRGLAQEAKAAYETALEFLPTDPLVKEFLAYLTLLTGNLEAGLRLGQEALATPSGYTIGEGGSLEDLLSNKVDLEGIEAIYMWVDESRESILAKQQRIKATLDRHPEFRGGLFHLAITHLQLGRTREAAAALETLHSIDKENLIALFYLSNIHAARHDYPKAWDYLRQAEAQASIERLAPKVLKELRSALNSVCPE